MGKVIIILISLLLISCKEESPLNYLCINDYGYETNLCEEDQKIFKWNCDTQKQSRFIIDCAKAANPMSDEEGEDLVKQCHATSKDLFCKKEAYLP